MFTQPPRTVLHRHGIDLGRKDNVWLGQPIDRVGADCDADVAEAGEVQIRMMTFCFGDLRHAVEELDGCKQRSSTASVTSMRCCVQTAVENARHVWLLHGVVATNGPRTFDEVLRDE